MFAMHGASSPVVPAGVCKLSQAVRVQVVYNGSNTSTGLLNLLQNCMHPKAFVFACAGDVYLDNDQEREPGHTWLHGYC